jgi:hypothetical protein
MGSAVVGFDVLEAVLGHEPAQGRSMPGEAIIPEASRVFQVRAQPFGGEGSHARDDEGLEAG